MATAHCSFDGEDVCEIAALPGKAFCSKHLSKNVNIEGESVKVEKSTFKRAAQSTIDESPETAATLDPEQFIRKPRTKAIAPNQHQDNPELVGSAMAEQLINDEYSEKLRRAGVVAPRRLEDGVKRVPFKVIPRRVRKDQSAITDPYVPDAQLVPKGWVPRWVSEVDWDRRPSQARVAGFEDYGYEFVRNTQGEIVRGHLGVAMMAPPQQYALRVKEHAPLGGMSRQQTIESAEEMIDQGNSQAGIEAARLYVEQDHGATKHFDDSKA